MNECKKPADPKTGKCISTGNVKDIYKMENKKLLELLEFVDMMDTGIRLPAGEFISDYLQSHFSWLHRLHSIDCFIDASYDLS